MNLDRLKEKIKQGRLSIDALHNIDLALCKEEAVEASGSGWFWLFQCVGAGCSQSCAGDACSQGGTTSSNCRGSCSGTSCSISCAHGHSVL